MQIHKLFRFPAAAALCLSFALATSAIAELKLPAIFGDNMVVQQGQVFHVWGWDNAGQEIHVKLDNGNSSGKAGDDGKWHVEIKAGGATGKPIPFVVEGSSKIEYKNVVLGEVWLCSGQSNMQWAVAQSNDADLEVMTAKYPEIRLITVPLVGTQEPQDNFIGQWDVCTPETVGQFSAVGYFFGRTLHQALDVPIGLVDNSWGGSSAEAWVRRDVLEADEAFKPYLDQWKQTEATFDWEKLQAEHKKKVEAAKAAGKPAPGRPRNVLVGQHRPGNLYNGVLKPVIGFSMRGAIWYQGESNSGRAKNYRELFPLMISHWRDEWGQGDFPFYWVQLADFRDEQPEPAESTWAELQEAQTMTLSLKNSGQAVIYDIGEGRDIHPRDKQNAAKRLARHALAKDYGIEVAAESPRYASHEISGNKIVLSFDHIGARGLYTFDVKHPVGFAIAGEDKKFVWAQGELIGNDKIAVWADGVDKPVAVRYAWADNPVANVQSREGLPLTPFRTDDWAMLSDPATQPK
ncbi:MAG: sialate O-acetylesterase [Verrucomicrobiales bacterium]|jgi:sialate O-acetylesterase